MIASSVAWQRTIASNDMKDGSPATGQVSTNHPDWGGERDALRRRLVGGGGISRPSRSLGPVQAEVYVAGCHMMTSSAAQGVKQNLISTVGGEVTIPGPVKGLGFLLKQGRVIARVKDSVFEIENDDFLNRISWDRASGLFALRRLQSKDSGDYSVDVNETLVSFKLSVYGRASWSPAVTRRSVSSRGLHPAVGCGQLSGGTLSGDEDKEEPIWLFRIVIPIISGVTFILFLSVIIFYVDRHLQASIQQKGGVTQQEEPEHGRCNKHIRYNEIQAKENLKE
ncbi:unnamed protein product [Boreogadus saida]